MLSMPSCPWGDYRAGTVSFCEARLCAWVVEPANAWSNLGFLVMAGVILAATWRRPHLSTLRVIAVTSALVGVGSFVFHASGTFLGEVVDLTTMYLISGLMLVLELRRLVPMSTWQVVVLYAAVVTASSGLLGPFPPIGIAVFVVHLVAWVAIHVFSRVRQPTADYRFSNWMAATWMGAGGIWLLDITKVLCDPHNHTFNGHATWHVLCAVCLGLYFRYQVQFFGPYAVPMAQRAQRQPIVPAVPP
ncbi:MAG: ceramidase [Myxococcaceae bacterium]|nr:ceramidase [Myxococcaceae bacterium]MCI0669089.1 ceramidase [Myxococcaceae bacterium]